MKARIRRSIGFLLAFLMLVSSFSNMISAEEKLKVVVQGKELIFKAAQAHVDVGGEVWIPALPVAQIFAKKVYWNPSKQKMTIVLPNQEVSYIVGHKKKYIASKSYDINVAPVLKEGKLILPLKEVLELFSQSYYFDHGKNTAYVFDPERLLMKSLVRSERIKDEFFYVCDWTEKKDEIQYELRRNVDEGGMAFLQGRFLYQMKTGNLYELGIESEERRSIGTFPINSVTSSEYKMTKRIKLERDPKHLKEIAKVITELIRSDSSIIKLNKSYKIDSGTMGDKKRGKVMYVLIKDDFPRNKSKAINGEPVEGGLLPVNMKRVEDLSRILLGGPADLKEYRRNYGGKNDYLIMADGIMYPQILPKYIEEKGAVVILTGDIVWYGNEFEGQIRDTVGDFRVELERNSKSLWDGYSIKNLEYSYHKDPMGSLSLTQE